MVYGTPSASKLLTCWLDMTSQMPSHASSRKRSAGVSDTRRTSGCKAEEHKVNDHNEPHRSWLFQVQTPQGQRITL